MPSLGSTGCSSMLILPVSGGGQSGRGVFEDDKDRKTAKKAPRTATLPPMARQSCFPRQLHRTLAHARLGWGRGKNQGAYKPNQLPHHVSLHIRIYIYMCVCVHTYTYIYTHTHTYKRTHAHTRTHSYTYTHTRTPTHRQS